MYAENRGTESDEERPPEMTMPTGSSDDVSVLFFIMMCGVRCVPGTVGDALSQGTPDASGLKIRNVLSGSDIGRGRPHDGGLGVSH